MPDQILIGKFSQGLTTNPLPFNIDNDAFPFMFNFYTWRERAKRKRGTIFLGQLQIQEQIAASPIAWQLAAFNLVAGAGNLITQYTLGASATIVPGSINLAVAGDQTYTDPNLDGTLTGSSGGTGTINYATGAFTAGATNGQVTGFFNYFPGLPVMGLEDLNITASLYPLLLAFDTRKAYQATATTPVTFYDVSFYKGSNNPVTWNGGDYQQFWSTNYSGAFWATNSNPGFHFRTISAITKAASAVVTLNSVVGLVVGDSLWFNEVQGMTQINGLTGTVTNVNSGASQVTVNINSSAFSNYSSAGIVQTLTASTAGQDGIKWYDGDPTAGTGLPTGTGLGWVNFAPPLTAATVSIDNTPAALYYLVGALAILPYKDRLLFFGPYIQSSSGNAILLQDTVIWSWNGTPYYSSLVPTGQTSNVKAYYVDQTGLGGWLSAGIEQAIVTITNNEDVLLIGFNQRQTRFVYTGNDLQPFLFFSINSELGSSATFSGVTIDRGGITLGRRGIVLTTQQSAQRIDLQIPDSVFQVQALNNGAQRVNAVRDYFREWIYFAYPLASSLWKFPTQTFLWNYRDDTWAVFYENFTTHGTFRFQNKNTWASIGQKFKTWAQWREPWNSGSTQPLFPSIIGGNPQGYVLVKGQGTGEGISGTILGISNSNGASQISSINACVNPGDYLYFQGAISTTQATITGISNATQAVVAAVNTFSAGQWVLFTEVAGMTQINGRSAQIVSATGANFTINLDTTSFSAYTSGGLATFMPLQNTVGKVVSINVSGNSFVVDIPFVSATYNGLGQFVRLSQPLLQTKQFPMYWDQGRQVILKAQKYLMDFTPNGQITVNIYLSTDPDDAWNDPILDAPTNSLEYSQILFTSPEYVPQKVAQNNLGAISSPQQAIITGISKAAQAVVTATNTFSTGQWVAFSGVNGMTQINGQSAQIVAASPTSFTINLNTSAYGVYVSGGIASLSIFNFQLTAPVIPGSVTFTVGSVATFTDNGIGGFTATGSGSASGSSINYATGSVSLVFNITPSAQITTVSYQYTTTNLQMPTAEYQYQIWHRLNTSLIGGTFQIGLTLSDAQMRSFSLATQEITLHAMVLVTDKGPHLA